MRVISDLQVYFSKMILNAIIFQYVMGSWGCLGVQVKMFRVCGYPFFNAIINVIIFQYEKGYESIFRFVSTLFQRDYKYNYFFNMKGGHRDVWGECKIVRVSRVCFLKFKSIQTKNLQKVRQNRLFTTTGVRMN